MQERTKKLKRRREKLNAAGADSHKDELGAAAGLLVPRPAALLDSCGYMFIFGKIFEL